MIKHDNISSRNQWITNVNTLRPRQHGRRYPDDIFKCIFLNENICIPINISLNFVPKGQIKNIPPLVQIMAWRRPGDKPLFEPMMVNLVTHICITRPQWVNTWTPILSGHHFPDDTFNCIFLNENVQIPIKIPLAFVPKGPINSILASIQTMAWRRLADKPLSEPMIYMCHSFLVSSCSWNSSTYGNNVNHWKQLNISRPFKHLLATAYQWWRLTH